MLLIIDPQEGFRYTESEAIIPNILNLLSKWDCLISLSLFFNLEGSSFEKWLGWKKFQNESDRQIWTELKAFKIVTFKYLGYTVLTSELIDLIKINSIGAVFIAGVYTDVCVIKIAMDLFDIGIEPIVMENYCASLHSNKQHQFEINSLKHIIGQERVINFL